MKCDPLLVIVAEKRPAALTLPAVQNIDSPRLDDSFLSAEIGTEANYHIVGVNMHTDRAHQLAV